MTQETGIQSSYSEDDIKEYLEQVIQEVKSERFIRLKVRAFKLEMVE